MFTVISALIFIVAILLVMIVLVQNSKGGGLAANFSSSNQVMGVRKTADFLEKTTWTLAASLMILSLLAAASIPRAEMEVERSIIEEEMDRRIDPSQGVPTFPVQEPGEIPVEEEVPPVDPEDMLPPQEDPEDILPPQENP